MGQLILEALLTILGDLILPLCAWRADENDEKKREEREAAQRAD